MSRISYSDMQEERKGELRHRARESYAQQRAFTSDALQFMGPRVIHPSFTYDSSHIRCAN